MSAGVGEIRSPERYSVGVTSEEEETAALEAAEIGQLQVEREERRKNKKMPATESARMRTGTVITIPFCCVNAIFVMRS